MPVPATLTNYLPVLLVSVTNTVPDDSAYETQPEGQVDYLSHNWREEDVWRSWRSMTRQKNAIVNGMRLENASWRTWWKQRNKLKTISPETLNWLKDSDVTWLYGPLHVGTDWQEMAHHEGMHPAPHPDALSSRPTTPSGKKPILKHRSIIELLSLPASPLNRYDSDESIEDSSDPNDESDHNSRPLLMHTKSDTHLSWRSRQFRKDSPPRIIASPNPEQEPHTHVVPSSGSSNTGASDQETSTGADGSTGGKKKHISFNTFVEQYISIDKPTPKRRASSTHFVPTVHEGYEDDSEAGEDDDSDQPSSYYMNKSGGLDTDSDDEDDDEDEEVLEMRSRSSSASSTRTPAMRKLSPPMPSRRPTLSRQMSTDRERATIAPIPPAMLKTTGVGNGTGSVTEDRALSSQKEVELVYVPPTNSIYSQSNTPNIQHEDVYHHRESYFSVGTGPPVAQSRSADSSPIKNTFSLPPVPREPPRQVSHSQDLSQFFGQQPLHDTPTQQHSDDVREEDAYDYFGGSDLGEDYHSPRSSSLRSRRSLSDVLDEDQGGGGVVRYGQGGASSVPTGRHSGSWSSPVSSSPRIVVNEVAGATDEREELSTGSSGSPSNSSHALPLPHRVPDTKKDVDIPLAVSFIHNGPAVPVPVPRIVTHSSAITDSPPETAYLSPTDSAMPTRGRSPQCSPVSTTTGSYSLSSESRSESRGRSSTRNSSFSDRERSGSRSSRGTSSPMGSISPTGSAIGMGGSYQVRGRDKDGRPTMQIHRRGSSGAENERGRDRTGRKIGDSLSPPNVIGSPARTPSVEFPAYSPVLEAKPASSSASVSGSSVSGSSTASVATITAHGDDHGAHVKGGIVSSRPLHIPIPSPIPEEEETRSRQPTPANSPVRALSSHQAPASPTTSPPTSPTSPTSPQHHHSPSSPLHVSPPAKSRPSEPMTSPSEAQAMPGAPLSRTERHARAGTEGHEHHPQHGLVGRAVDIVHSARGFLGAIWNAV